ncbi:MAG: hypothetical protein DRM99_05490 [Thermoplasmata archaeon]|nr:MAG: hypothetical protein DRM99_05490 [Thermoplasmata archaeon]
MTFNIKKRDGPGRTGELEIGGKTVVTPNIFFINTERFKAPDFADLTISNKKDLLKLEHLFIVENAKQLFQKPEEFVEKTVELEEKEAYNKAIFLPSVAEPVSLSLLVYLGIDLFDSTPAIISARNNELFFTNEKINKNSLKELPCSCPVCSKYKGKPSEMSFNEILKHNYYILIDEIKKIRNAIHNNQLRNLVESRIVNSPHLTSILRNLNMKHYSFLEKHTPLVSNSTIPVISKDSFNRPEIKRFQERVIKRYKKPVSTKILLLLPCSAKKPYSFSKSHKLFREKLMLSGNPNVVHELIITSPIGIVPRELELVYPASSYDIPVTGIWDEDEKKMIRELLTSYLKNNRYDKTIAHLPNNIMEFIRDLLTDPIETCIDKPTSKKSLEKLSTVLKENASNYEKIKQQTRNFENIKTIAMYQFTIDVAEKLLKNSTIKGKYPQYRIMHNKTQLGMLVKEKGMITLTLQGGERIASTGKYYVEIYDDFTLKGTLFAPGVKDADPDIRPGDEVVILQNKKTYAVGVAMMNGEEMKKTLKGIAVKTRHHL